MQQRSKKSKQRKGRMEQSQRIERDLFKWILFIALHQTITNWYEAIIDIYFYNSTWFSNSNSWHYTKDIGIFITDGTRKKEPYPSYHPKWIQLLLMDNFYYIFCHQHISDIKGGTSVLRILPNKCTAVNYICKKVSSEIFEKVLNSPPDT